MRLAVWSGPRNLSTAMMYSFAQRADFTVWDEPFYGPYLRLTGLNHPMRDEVLKSRPENAEQIEQTLLKQESSEKTHLYHKHMCQHMIDGIPRSFMIQCKNVFLLRHPARVVASFAKNYPEVDAEDIGFAKQAELFSELVDADQQPLVLDSEDVRRNPEHMLRFLCERLGLPWDSKMLAWPEGPKPYDGAWAPVWYKSLHATTGFAGPEGPLPELSGRLASLANGALPHYELLREKAIKG